MSPIDVGYWSLAAISASVAVTLISIMVIGVVRIVQTMRRK